MLILSSKIIPLLVSNWGIKNKKNECPNLLRDFQMKFGSSVQITPMLIWILEKSISRIRKMVTK